MKNPTKESLGRATTWELLDEIRARLQSIDMLDYRIAGKPKKKKVLDAFPSDAKEDVRRKLVELSHALEDDGMSLLGVFTNLKILIANLERSGMSGPKVESSRTVIERAEAKPPPPAEKSDAISKLEVLQGVIMRIKNGDVDMKHAYPGIMALLKSLIKLAIKDTKLDTKVVEIYKASQKDDLLQSIMVLSYLCRDLGYSLSIKRPYNTTRWHVTASESETTVVKTASSPHLPDAVEGLRDLLAGDWREVPTEVKKTPAQIVADLEANALDFIAEVKRIKKKKEVDSSAAALEDAVNMVLVEKRTAVERAMRDYERALKDFNNL